MKIIKDIWNGLFNYTLHFLGFTYPDWDKVYDQRLRACETCPLKSGIWCSAKKSVRVINNQKLLIKNPTGVVTGCGCVRKLKAATQSPCPLNRWENFEF